MDKTIGVDFDGVIHAYSKGWCDGTIYDPPKLGCKEALSFLMSLGYEILIFSTRCNDPVEREKMIEYLHKHEIPYTTIYDGKGKPLMSLIIDDNAIRFDTNWVVTLADVLEKLRKYHT